MTTALEIITAAMQQCQIYAPGEPISAPDQQTGLFLLNGMLDSFSAGETLTCFADTTVSKLLTPNVTRYSIGSVGADITAVRPIEFPEGYGYAWTLDANSNNYPINIVTHYEWNLISNLTQNFSTYPDTMWYDAQMPLGYINLYPVPTGAPFTLYLTYPQILANLTLDQTFSLPQGYQEMIMSNLCVRLKPFFIQAQLDPLIYELAKESKANVKRSNLRIIRSRVDSEIVAKAPGTYNIYTDNYNAFPPRR